MFIFYSFNSAGLSLVNLHIFLYRKEMELMEKVQIYINDNAYGDALMLLDNAGISYEEAGGDAVTVDDAASDDIYNILDANDIRYTTV